MHVYIIQCGDTTAYKVGISVNPRRRLQQLQTGCPHRLKLLFNINVSNARGIEHAIHAVLIDHGVHILNEWFTLSNDDVVSIARQLIRHSNCA